MNRSRRYRELVATLDRERVYPVREAIELMKRLATAKFPETAEAAFNLGINPSQHMVRGSVSLPHGTGRTVRVLVFARGEKIREAEEAGADYVGGEELVEKIQKEGWLDFDRAVATPDMMKVVSRLGKILGPRGLMPSAKVGTVTFDVAKAVKEAKAGKIEYRVDKGANIHVPVGKISFDTHKLVENVKALVLELLRAKPAAAKGKYIKSVHLSTTMGPSVALDTTLLLNELR